MKYIFITFIFLFFASCQGRNAGTGSSGINDAVLIVTDDETTVNQVDVVETTVYETAVNEVRVDEMTTDEVVTSESVDIPVSGLPIIRINPGQRTTGQLTLNDLAKSIEYIPLETKNNCIIGTVNQCVISDNHILLFSKVAKVVYLFKRTGEFVAQIGGIGGGPGEYTQTAVSPVYVDEINNQVILYINTLSNLNYYTLNGKFIKSVSLENDITSEFSLHNGFLLRKHFNAGNGQTPFSYSILNSNLAVVAQKVNPVQYNTKNRIMGIWSDDGYFCEYVYNGRVYVREKLFNDTIYVINNDFSFTPKYIINSNKDLPVKEFSENFILAIQNLYRNNLMYESIFETNDFLCISYRFQARESYCYYQKQDNRLMFSSSSSGIPNDYDGGLDFWPKVQMNNQLFAFYNAYRFKENENTLKPQGPADAVERLNQLTRTIDPEDNPVMVIVTLK